MSKDWEQWHTGYDNEAALAERLQIVQTQIRRVLPEKGTAPFVILDLCAGDGRDLIGVLADYPYKDLVHGRLVEINEGLAGEAQTSLNAAGLGNLEVVTGDASQTDNYIGAVPADMVTLCGIFGNISNKDIEKTLRALPTLCKTGGKVIWTRNRRPPDFTPTIRNVLAEAGFVELDFIAPEGNARMIAVGVNEFAGETQPLPLHTSLFTFTK